MLAGIPFLGFVLIFTAFLRGRPRDDPRDILLSAALVCGVIVVAATEALSLFGLLAPPSIAVSWVAVAVGATLVAVKLKKGGPVGGRSIVEAHPTGPAGNPRRSDHGRGAAHGPDRRRRLAE
jgi:hypothetical protein